MYSKQVVKNVFLKEEALSNRGDMSIYMNIHCKLQPIYLSGVKENPGLRTMFYRPIET